MNATFLLCEAYNNLRHLQLAGNRSVRRIELTIAMINLISRFGNSLRVRTIIGLYNQEIFGISDC